ncbi:MAG: hypothetical protein RLZZ300_798 [Pseudomonadota bacterium]
MASLLECCNQAIHINLCCRTGRNHQLGIWPSGLNPCRVAEVQRLTSRHAQLAGTDEHNSPSALALGRSDMAVLKDADQIAPSVNPADIGCVVMNNDDLWRVDITACLKPQCFSQVQCRI